MLDSLAERGVALALVTNKREHLARRLLAELGLSDRFFTLIGGDTLGPGRGKPAPDPLLEMIARGPPGRAAYVGDTTYDTRAAPAVRFGFCDVPPDELGADALIDSFADLIPTLERL
jgi:phosphoglycolate phosphatase